MKFPINWINENLYQKLNIKKIKYTFNKYGFESKYINITKKLQKKNFIFIKIKLITKKKNILQFYYKIKNNIHYINVIHNNYLYYKPKYLLISNKNIKKYNKKNTLKYQLYYYINQYIIILDKNYKNIIFIKQYLIKNLILNINIPYNRIDCHNIYGISRELAIIKKIKIKNIIKNIPCIFKKDKNKIIIHNSKNKIFCQNYFYYILTNIKNKYFTPIFIKYRLKQINIKIHNNFLDLINYILIESGQIINIFNADQIKKNEIKIYFTNNKLSNNYHKNLIYKINHQIIYNNYNSYNKKYIINNNTSNIFIGAPLLTNNYIFRTHNKKYKNILYSYISNINKKTQYLYLYKTYKILNYILHINNKKIIIFYSFQLQKKNYIKLNYQFLYNTLGIYIIKKNITNILLQLKYTIFTKNKKQITVLPPLWKCNIFTPIDIIEDITRIYGYDNIPNKSIYTNLRIYNTHNNDEYLNKIKILWINLGYYEAINYHLTHSHIEHIFKYIKYPNIKLIKPITHNMNVLRTTLIPGLLFNVINNIRQQIHRIKLFEIGSCYYQKKTQFFKTTKLAVIIHGYKYKDHWSLSKNIILNFYDLKGNLEYIINKYTQIPFINIIEKNYYFLEPGNSGDIYINDKKIGIIGMINTKIQKKYLLLYSTYILEINMKYIIPKYKKYLPINYLIYKKRDITLIIDYNTNIYKIIQFCLSLNIINIKKIYISKIFNSIELTKNHQKNITLTLIIKNQKKLLDNHLNELIKLYKQKIKQYFNAIIK